MEEQSESGRDDRKEDGILRRQAAASFAVLYLVSFIEGADFQLLPSSFRALETDMHLTPSGLAALSLWQSLACSLSSPVWGTLVDNGFSPKKIILMGMASWGTITLLLACVESFAAMLVLRILNGLALATLNPVVQGIIADLAPPEERGRYFGWCGFSMNLGNVVCALATTSISNKQVFGVAGWRVAFAAVGLGSIFLALPVAIFMADHRRMGWRSTSILTELSTLVSYFHIRTFTMILAQGCFGSIPWSAMAFLTMFLQYGGLPDSSAGMVMSIYMLTCAVGQVIGGYIGDFLALWSMYHGRALTAQISVSCGIPLVFAVLYLVPRGPDSVVLYATLLALFGLAASWCANGTNRPILSEVVPRSSQARIFALLAALEGSSSACLGAPVVALLAENVFQYHPEHRAMSEIPQDVRHNNLEALAAAMLWMTIIPWVVCFFFYGLLHWTYRNDLEALRREKEADEPLSGQVS